MPSAADFPDSPPMARFPFARPRPASATKVAAPRGIIFQSDAASWLGTALIRPAEHLDQRWAGLREAGDENGAETYSPLAMHAGLHVVLFDGREMVVEQLSGDLLARTLRGRPALDAPGRLPRP